jgi:hypothetical protein
MANTISAPIARIQTLFLTALVILSVTTTLAQTDSQLADRVAAERLTNSLLELNTQYQAAGPAAKTELLGKVVDAATKRQQFLSSIMETNSAEVLRVAIPANIVANLPAPAQAVVEQEVDLQGELEVMMEDGPTSAKLHHFLNTGKERVELHFAGEPPTDLLTGAIVRVHGVQVQSGLALTSSSGTSTVSSVQTVTSAPLPNTFGAQKTLVILVNFQDNTSQPWTVAQAQSLVFTTVSNFWMENSIQQTWLTGDVAGWFTLPITSAGVTCDSTFWSTIKSDALQSAQNAGYVLPNYNHFVYAFPQLTTCSWEGMSGIGGNPSNSMVNGLLTQEVVGHELGHALGLYHSHSLGCGSLVYASGGCTQYEYGDYYETMGNSNFGGNSMDYNAFQRERLGWLNSGAQPPITSVSSSGTYEIGPYEAQDGTAKALKILQSSTSSTYYYVESRQAIGFDYMLVYGVPAYGGVLNGVVVHAASPSNANSSDLLDMNPASTWGTAMALDAGQSYTDSTAGITISTTSVSTTGATVQVTLSGPVCTHSNPTVSISPSQSQWVSAGTPVNFTFSMTNNDNSSCSSTVFNLAGSVPNGWSSSLGSSSLTLAPGSSGSATLQVTSPAGTANGFYNVAANADNSSATSYAASASGTYVIATPGITVSTNQANYSRGQTVSITVSLTSGSSPVSGAGVTVNITKSNGTVVTLTSTTGSNGTTTLTYKLKKTDPVGTYKVSASSSSGGNSATISAGTSFGVQ